MEEAIAIEVNNVSKAFRIHGGGIRTLKDAVVDRRRYATSQLFWALRNINLQVPRGQTLGLIGRNGSGKSTLLKVISRILFPTSGTVSVVGRVSSLLELGAGFHDDFTGIENIYLNASILGLKRREIRERIPDIVRFAELEAFIDRPVRNYSSGMYMRLGFAVAVHVDPEILIIDEILAVGDIGFQEKCMERLAGLQHRGKTIVLVSHSPKQVADFCNYAVWIHEGAIQTEGPARDVTNAYVKFMEA